GPPLLDDGFGRGLYMPPLAKKKKGALRLPSPARLALRQCDAFSSLISSISRVIATSSPTTTPPASRALFQETLKSWRLMVVVAVRPRRILPPGSFTSA